MANITSPFGAQDLRRIDGGSPTMGLEQHWIMSSDPTAIFNGDLVQANLQTPVTGNPYSYITQGTSALATGVGSYKGVFRGCEYYSPTVGRIIWSQYFPGTGSSGDIKCYVQTDGNLMYLAQATSAAVLGSSNISQTIQTTGTTSAGNASSNGNTTTGISAAQVGSSSVSSAATNSSYAWRIYGFYTDVLGGGSSAFATYVNGLDNTSPGQVLVLLPNNFMTKSTTGDE